MSSNDPESVNQIPELLWNIDILQLDQYHIDMVINTNSNSEFTEQYIDR